LSLKLGIVLGISDHPVYHIRSILVLNSFNVMEEENNEEENQRR
jgi:hypothetical protein